jgi:hypothetical protein
VRTVQSYRLLNHTPGFNVPRRFYPRKRRPGANSPLSSYPARMRNKDSPSRDLKSIRASRGRLKTGRRRGQQGCAAGQQPGQMHFQQVLGGIVSQGRFGGRIRQD